jgi:hypothetical protein
VPYLKSPSFISPSVVSVKANDDMKFDRVLDDNMIYSSPPQGFDAADAVSSHLSQALLEGHDDNETLAHTSREVSSLGYSEISKLTFSYGHASKDIASSYSENTNTSNEQSSDPKQPDGRINMIAAIVEDEKMRIASSDREIDKEKNESFNDTTRNLTVSAEIMNTVSIPSPKTQSQVRFSTDIDAGGAATMMAQEKMKNRLRMSHTSIHSAPIPENRKNKHSGISQRMRSGSAIYSRQHDNFASPSDDEVENNLKHKNMTVGKIRQLLAMARHDRSMVEIDLVGAITMREKLLERVHYLQALKRIALQPPPTPTRCLGPTPLPSIDHAISAMETLRSKVHHITTNEQKEAVIITAEDCQECKELKEEYHNLNGKSNYNGHDYDVFLGSEMASFVENMLSQTIYDKQDHNKANMSQNILKQEDVIQFNPRTYSNASDKDGSNQLIASVQESLESETMSVGIGDNEIESDCSDYLEDWTFDIREINDNTQPLQDDNTGDNGENLVKDVERTPLSEDNLSNLHKDQKPMIETSSNDHEEELDDTDTIRDGSHDRDDTTQAPQASFYASQHLRQRKLGAPPQDLATEFDHVMKNLNTLWLCELDTFETIQQLTSTLHQREHVWQLLRKWETQIEAESFVIPKQEELYEIAI